MNVAVNLDDSEPIRCASRFLKDDPVLVLRAFREIHRKKSGIETVGDVVILRSDDDANDVADPRQPCSLLKAAFIALGIVSSATVDALPLNDRLLQRYRGGIEVACISYLPVGSGLGGSSIVAAAVLQSICTLIGRSMSREELIDLVSYVEQIMTTGGGWQDQVGAVYPSFKITSSSNQLPLKLAVQPINLPDTIITAFEERTFLIYTGRQVSQNYPRLVS
jgi:fucokinase